MCMFACGLWCVLCVVLCLWFVRDLCFSCLVWFLAVVCDVVLLRVCVFYVLCVGVVSLLYCSVCVFFVCALFCLLFVDVWFLFA